MVQFKSVFGVGSVGIWNGAAWVAPESPPELELAAAVAADDAAELELDAVDAASIDFANMGAR